MIRDKRAFIAVNLAGAACGLYLLIAQSLYPPTHPVYPHWFSIALAVTITAGFIYNVVLRMRGPIQPARWVRGMSDGQLWLIKGVLAVGVVIAATLLLLRLR